MSKIPEILRQVNLKTNLNCSYKTRAYTLLVPLHWGVISTGDCILGNTFEYLRICTVP